MRHFPFLLFFLLISSAAFSQHVYKIKTDSLLVTNDSCTAELILENSTKFVKGFLYNKGKGRTEFRRALIKITDSTYQFGDDTLNFRSLLNTIGFSGSNIYNSNGSIGSDRFINLDTSQLSFGKNSITYMQLFNNGNLWLGNGTPSNGNYKLDIGGNTILRNGTLVFTSGTYNKSNINIKGREGNTISFTGTGSGGNIVIGDDIARSSFTIYSSDNIMVGRSAAPKLSGSDGDYVSAGSNIFIGRESGYDITSGRGNVFIGHYSGRGNIANGISTGNVSHKFMLAGGVAEPVSAQAFHLLYGDFLTGQLVVNPSANDIPSINSSIAFAINSVNKGFLPPRWTINQRTSISTPATGLIGFQTDSTEGQYVKLSSGWKRFLTDADIGSTIVSSNIYTANGTLSGNRTINLADASLTISKDTAAYLHLFNNGNLLLGNKAAVTDAGYKFDVTGNSMLRGVIFQARAISIAPNIFNKTFSNATSVVLGDQTQSGQINDANVLIGYDAGKNIGSSNTGEAAMNIVIGREALANTVTTGVKNVVIGTYIGSSLWMPLSANSSYKFMLGNINGGGGSTLMGGDMLQGSLWINPTTANITSPDASVAFGINARNTGIGNSTAYKGFLAPIMTSANRISITTPATGLQVFQTDSTEGHYIKLSTGWSRFLTDADIGTSVVNTNFYKSNGNLAVDRTVTLGSNRLNFSTNGSYRSSFSGSPFSFQIADDAAWDLGITRFGNNGSPANIVFVKTRGSNADENLSLANNDFLMRIAAVGVAANNFLPGQESLRIFAGVYPTGGIPNFSNGAVPASTEVPTSFNIATSGISSGLLTRFTIYPDGEIILANMGATPSATSTQITSNRYKLQVFGSTSVTGNLLLNATQGVTNHSSAQFEMVSTTQGFLPPRMTGAQAEAISSPAEGLMVYATNGNGTTITSKGWWGYNGTTWEKLNN